MEEVLEFRAPMKKLGEITTTFQIHSNSAPHSCPECREHLRVEPGMRIEEAINHLLTHGYQLLHIGSEWSEDSSGKSISHTVAVLGK